jgi:hypothetical protein
MALVETLNAVGVALSSNPTGSNQELGSHLTIGALVIQFCVIVAFVILAALFHYRCMKAGLCTNNVSTPLNTLYISMALIFVRCIYRLVEHSGYTKVNLHDPESLRNLSVILRYEWFFYVFEAALMLVNSALWNIWNPGRYLPKHNHIYLSQDGSTEVEGQYETDSRPLLAKAGSILTFGVLFRKKSSQGRQYQLSTLNS